VSAELAHELQAAEQEAPRALSLRVRFVRALAPLTILAGIVWAVVQPYRLTLLHPHAEGFWWLFSEPPLYVVLVGVLFRFFVTPGLLEDLEE
jgi:uncharacterized membrane protein